MVAFKNAKDTFSRDTYLSFVKVSGRVHLAETAICVFAEIKLNLKDRMTWKTYILPELAVIILKRQMLLFFCEVDDNLIWLIWSRTCLLFTHINIHNVSMIPCVCISILENRSFTYCIYLKEAILSEYVNTIIEIM